MSYVKHIILEFGGIPLDYSAFSDMHVNWIYIIMNYTPIFYVSTAKVFDPLLLVYLFGGRVHPIVTKN